MTGAAIALLAATLLLLAVLLAAARRRIARAHHDAAEENRELRERAAHAEQQRADYLGIFEGAAEGLLAIDRQRRVVLANAAFAAIFDVDEDIAGKPLIEVVRVAPLIAGFDAALAGERVTEVLTIGFGVADRRVEMRALPLASAGIAAVGSFVDVTHVQRLERIRRNFISDFSHEVRTPLTGLRSAVDTFELGRGHMSDDEEQQLRRIMTRQLARLERLVDDLSELSRIESGDLSLERHPVELRALVEELCEDFAERAAQKGVKLAVSGDRATVRADAVRIQQAFSNLIDNAIKYGGENASVDISVAGEDDAAVVRITDHGEGIAREEQERIFRRFYRIDKSRSQDIAGTGLGLAITKHLVLLHQGKVEVESEPGRGATFVVSLPKG